MESASGPQDDSEVHSRFRRHGCHLWLHVDGLNLVFEEFGRMEERNKHLWSLTTTGHDYEYEEEKNRLQEIQHRDVSIIYMEITSEI